MPENIVFFVGDCKVDALLIFLMQDNAIRLRMGSIERLTKFVVRMLALTRLSLRFNR
jgi:hypothetical protein